MNETRNKLALLPYDKDKRFQFLRNPRAVDRTLAAKKMICRVVHMGAVKQFVAFDPR